MKDQSRPLLRGVGFLHSPIYTYVKRREALFTFHPPFCHFAQGDTHLAQQSVIFFFSIYLPITFAIEIKIITIMKSKMKLFSIWFFVAPSLMFEKLNMPWYNKILLVVLSPFTAFILFMLSIFFSMVTAPTLMCFPTNHQLTGAEDISELTGSYIPPCDTIGAFYESVGIDGTDFENFYMQHPLTSSEAKKLRRACEKDSLWEENEKEYIYSRFSTEEYRHNSNTKIRFDKVVVRVPKATRHIKVEFEHY